jgi:4-carboxymuconolactone decarboxylase
MHEIDRWTLCRQKEIAMNKEMFDRGLAIRKKVLGAEFVDKSFAAADEFNMPMQELTTGFLLGRGLGAGGIVTQDP